MKLEELETLNKNAFIIQEWKRCHTNYKVIDVMTTLICGWQWVTIIARTGHGKTVHCFHFNNKEEKSYWLTNRRYFWIENKK